LVEPRQLTTAAIPYETGIARYDELAKAEVLGDRTGMLKLLFHSETLKLLGIHAIGQRATEIIHIGRAVLAFDGTVEYFSRCGVQLSHASRGVQGGGSKWSK
jgi:NAD(P) transhydrogenase